MKDDKVKDKKKIEQNKVVLLVVLLVLLIMLILGFSFSMSNRIGNDISNSGMDDLINNIIGRDKTNSELIIFHYYEKNHQGNGINLVNQFPITDEMGKAFKGDNYTFEFRLIFNEPAAGMKYDIILEKLINSDLDPSCVKVYLESEGKILNNVLRDNGKLKTFNELANYRMGNQNKKIIYQGKISQAEARRGFKDFTFKMWVSEDVLDFTNYINKTFRTRINVTATDENLYK